MVDIDANKFGDVMVIKANLHFPTGSNQCTEVLVLHCVRSIEGPSLHTTLAEIISALTIFASYIS